jgi:hypothetical protein
MKARPTLAAAAAAAACLLMSGHRVDQAPRRHELLVLVR